MCIRDSPYSVKDYYAVDPHYGTVDDYKRFVAEAHKRGMKVIMDLVANHTAWDSVMMTNKDFYKQDAAGHVVPPVREWTDVAGLNYSSPALRQYMIAMLKYWIEEADVDGFRCDVAYMVPVDFWEQVRIELTSVKPDIMLLAEASKPELLVKAFDIDYSWSLLATMNNILIHNAPASDVRKSWEESRRQFPKNSLHLRISDDHDEARAVARYGLNGALAASALMFTLDGVPLLYNGMEVGDATESGDPALFDKLDIFWNPKERPQLRSIYHDPVSYTHLPPTQRHMMKTILQHCCSRRWLGLGISLVAALAAQAQTPVTFSIDMSPEASATAVYITGTFNGWSYQPPAYALVQSNSSSIWTNTFTFTDPPGTIEQGKFNDNVSGWESIGNRSFQLPASGPLVLPLTSWNDGSEPGWPGPTNFVTLQINMSAQVFLGNFTNDNNDAVGDPNGSITVSGDFEGWRCV